MRAASFFFAKATHRIQPDFRLDNLKSKTTSFC
jgi:hypothetical protein